MAAGEQSLFETCPTRIVAEDAWISSAVTDALTQRGSFNSGEVASSTPGNHWSIYFNFSATSDVTVYGSCVSPSSAFGYAPVRGGTWSKTKPSDGLTQRAETKENAGRLDSEPPAPFVEAADTRLLDFRLDGRPLTVTKRKPKPTQPGVA